MAFPRQLPPCRLQALHQLGRSHEQHAPAGLDQGEAEPAADGFCRRRAGRRAGCWRPCPARRRRWRAPYLGLREHRHRGEVEGGQRLAPADALRRGGARCGGGRDRPLVFSKRARKRAAGQPSLSECSASLGHIGLTPGRRSSLSSSSTRAAAWIVRGGGGGGGGGGRRSWSLSCLQAARFARSAPRRGPPTARRRPPAARDRPRSPEADIAPGRNRTRSAARSGNRPASRSASIDRRQLRPRRRGHGRVPAGRP